MICISPALEDYATEVVKEMKSNGIRAEVMSGAISRLCNCIFGQRTCNGGTASHTRAFQFFHHPPGSHVIDKSKFHDLLEH